MSTVLKIKRNEASLIWRLQSSGIWCFLDW